jgi:hypothetical protein
VEHRLKPLHHVRSKVPYLSRKLPLRHNDVISYICPAVLTWMQGDTQETSEFFFSASYDGVITAWEICERK